MSFLTDFQRSAVQSAQILLENAGLSPRDLDSFSSSSSSPSPPSSSPSPPPSPSSPPPSTLPKFCPASLSTRNTCLAVAGTRYTPPPAQPFTVEDRLQGRHCVTRKTSAHAIIEHPIGATVEYPQTRRHADESIAHIFHINPSMFTSTLHLKSSFQYSLGDRHGGQIIGKCLMLHDAGGQPVSCAKLRTSCKGLKICSGRQHDISAHHFTNVSEVLAHHPSTLRRRGPAGTADQELFEKTLAFFVALSLRGCSPHSPTDGQNNTDVVGDSSIDIDDDFEGLTADQYLDSISTSSDTDLHIGCIPSSRRPVKKKCNGRLVMHFDAYNQPFIRCSLHSRTACSHLFIRNLQESDTCYLQALLDDDHHMIMKCEQLAKSQGYGPLMLCSFVTGPSSQKQQGVLRKWAHNCAASFDIYVPEDLFACPRILVLCTNPHSHPPPLPVKTPPPLIDVFHKLVSLMKWKLADATPRRIYLDTAFVEGLHRVLDWQFPDGRDAMLQDLHPSLANLDHVCCLINITRSMKYPSGTGFEGARRLANEHASLPLEQRYVRCAETHVIERGVEFKLVVCMTSQMSSHLIQAKRLSIDTSFKRAQGWQEFEIESWDSEHCRSVVSARAFTTSQSAKAHLILFQQIFDIASADTGQSFSFHHIHGFGCEIVIADSHKGQGLGLGMYCVQLSRSISTSCTHEPHRRVSDLGPYDHLRRFYRLCVAHFKRNVHALRTHVLDEVYSAMLSLATCEEHPDIQRTFNTIRRGGPKAAAWLKDKLEGTKFALPALYQPMSLIPLALWKASPSTTNGKEQAHHNAYREGVHLTLLAGIMKGMKFDQGATSSMNVHATFGVSTRDQEATQVYRATRCIVRQTLAQKKRYKSSQPTATPQPLQLLTVRNVTMPIQPATRHTATTCAITMPPYDTVDEDSVLTTFNEPPSVSLHQPLMSSQISTFNSLSFALQPGARIIDYSLTSVPSPSLIIIDNSKWRISTYSSLAGALDEHFQHTEGRS
ncbi:uncharacterized protein F5147DRAFT_772592 [Suillus discolor]|uniref:Uncharacterized protein n=1 Tax=Suillus discolor TaxID=1912936 RepID=A0A9P7F9V1_9AGAM|nr:uncharacterized protein F5147DRAFT_772592 [Suillus discolor]KAG2110340.1 hypothetical protein F5147DRAFT_772592 [Suillus discolor]